jgi:hypothetical protein
MLEYLASEERMLNGWHPAFKERMGIQKMDA